MQIPPHDEPETTKPPRTVLVVDDEPEIRDMIAELLTHHGVEVRTASGGAEALEILSGPEPPDAIILDLMMPCVSGLHVLAAMRSRGTLQRVPRVIVSAMPVPAHVAADPLNRILQKPFDAARLVEATREALRISSRP